MSKGKLVHTITEEEARRGRLADRKLHYWVLYTMGAVQTSDAGKQILDVGGGLLLMESAEERYRRLAEEKESQADEREEALRKVLVTIRSPLLIMSRPHREETVELARRLDLTVEELLEIAYRRGRGA